jgi:hypothetical protein
MGYSPMVMNDTHNSPVPEDLFAAAVDWLAAPEGSGRMDVGA